MCSFAPLLHELLRYLLHRLIRCCTYLDGELAYIISFKGKPVLVLSFNVVKPMRESAPAIYIRQIQLLEKTGNRWLYQLPCHYVEHFVIRMREAFSQNDIYLIRGDVLGEETAQNYEATLKRIQERLKQNSYFSADGRSDDEQETAQFQEKVRNMRNEVIPRLQRNYARRSLVFHRFLRRKRGNYWKLHFRAPGKFVPAHAKKSDRLVIQQVHANDRANQRLAQTVKTGNGVLPAMHPEQGNDELAQAAAIN